MRAPGRFATLVGAVPRLLLITALAVVNNIPDFHQDRLVGKRNLVDAESNEKIVNAVERIAGERGVPMAQIALAWVLANPIVTSPIVGPTKPHHLADAVAAPPNSFHRPKH